MYVCTVLSVYMPSHLFPLNDFHPAFKWVWHLFRPQHLFPIIHLSKVEKHMLALVPTSLLAWLWANKFTNWYMDSTHWRKRKHINAGRQWTLWMHCCKSLIVTFYKRKIHILREISRMHSFFLMHNTILLFNKLNNCGTQCLNGPRHLFHVFYCNAQCIIESLYVCIWARF